LPPAAPPFTIHKEDNVLGKFAADMFAGIIGDLLKQLLVNGPLSNVAGFNRKMQFRDAAVESEDMPSHFELTVVLGWDGMGWEATAARIFDAEDKLSREYIKRWRPVWCAVSVLHAPEAYHGLLSTTCSL
jgi:hypothetical protein